MSEPCPTEEQLEQFVLGKLPEFELTPVAAHAESCPTCQMALTTLDEKQDALLARLRRGHRQTVDVEDGISRNALASGSSSDSDSTSEPRASALRLSEVSGPFVDSAAATISEKDDRWHRLVGRLEHLTDREDSAPSRDWMPWVRNVFGSNRADGVIRIGVYRLEQVLGVGGMGIVVEAHDDQLQRSVAIKVMRPERLADTAARQRFLREARAIAAIQHEHIVPVFQVGVEQNVPYFVMPLLRGRSLEERLRDTERCELLELLRLSIQIADGIAGAHAHGLIHRDIKPSNVWVEEVERQESGPPSTANQSISRNALASGSTVSDFTEVSEHSEPDASAFRLSSSQPTVKLLDFGLARAQLDDAYEPLSEAGMVMGTPAYMSPEQASGGDVDQRSDLFSLGCVMFRMATGALPFPGRTVTQQLTALIQGSARPLHELNDELPEELEELVQQLLKRDPNQRPNSAVEVRDRLQALLDEVEQDGTEDGPSVKRRKPRRKKTAAALMRRVITIGCAMLVVAVGTSLFVASRQQPTESQQLPTEQIANGSGWNPNLRAPRESLAELLAQLHLGQEWYDRVSSLPAIVRTEEVKAELKRRNPDIGDAVQFDLLSDRVRGLTIDTTALRDIAPLIALRELQSLRILNSKTREPLELTDLRPLRDLPLKELLIEHCPRLAGFESLNGKELTRVSFYKSPHPDSQWFARQKSIETLNLGGRSTPIDLTTLKHLPLVGLELNETPIKDLSPLAHHRLEMLRLANTQVSDLSHIDTMPLVRMDFRGTPVTDIKPLQKLKHLTFVMLDVRSQEQVAVLKSLKSLRLCNQVPVSDIADLLFDPGPTSLAVKPVVPFEPIEPWLQPVEKLPSPSLVEEVRSELCRRNLGLAGKLQLNMADETIHEVDFEDAPVADIGPLAALKDLQRLRIRHRRPGLPPRELTDLRPLIGLKKLSFVELKCCPELSDLSPLFDKPLLALSLYATPLPELNWIAGSSLRMLNLGGRDSPPDLNLLKRTQLERLELNESPVADISPLSDLPLRSLSIAATNVSDLKPLQRMPLVILEIQTPQVLDLSPLKSIPTLRHLRCKIQDRQQLAFIQSLTWLETVNRFPLNALEKEYPNLPQETPAAVVAYAKSLTEQNQSQAAIRSLAQRVHNELIERNAGYDATLKFDERDGRIVNWEIDSTVLEDISPLAQLPDLESIYFWNSAQLPRNLADLSPLRGKKLKHVTLLRFPKLQDFSALADMPLESLGLYATPLPDTQWLSTLKLKELRIGGRTEAVGLSFVKGMPLTKLGLQEAPFSDLRPLSGLKLEEIVITNTQVRDLSPLTDMPLKNLKCEACPLDDFQQILAFKQLQRIECTIRTATNIKVLRALPDLIEINHRPASDTLK